MRTTRYDENSIVSAKGKIDTCNEKILDALRTIYNETNSIGTVLNTPKSSKNVEEFLKYLDERVNYVGNSKNTLNRTFDMVETAYREEYLNAVNQMVGGNND